MYKQVIRIKLFFNSRSFILSLVVLKNFLFLSSNTFFTTFTSLFHLEPSGVRLICQHLGTCLLGLLFVDVFHENSLVLEYVTFSFHVQCMVEMSIDFFSFSVFFQQPSENSHALNPQFLEQQ